MNVKRIFALIGMLVLAFGSSYIANADDALVLDKSAFNDEAADANSMAWPMLPGESVNDLARLFYPKNNAMQQQFVAKTLRLNAGAQLKASQRFDAPALLQVPTLKSLSKSVAKASKKPSNKTLKMSYGLKRVIQLAPEKLLQEYEELISKNAFLKEQLVKLNEKIVILQAKLDDLKLIFDKTLTLPSSNLPIANQAIAIDVIPSETNTPLAEPVINAPPTELASGQPPAKKVFKNLNKVEKPEIVLDAPVEASLLDRFNLDILKIVLAAAALLLLGALVLKKYRQRMFEQLSFTATKMQNTVTDFSGYFEKTKQAKVEAGPETIQHQQAVKEVEVKLNSTLEEAKLLMSVNRATDAIAHLKMTIESQPRASINHWLYLLEVFRKLNLKGEFEEYAEKMHETFNVMTPVWYEKEAEVSAVMVIPQSLEEFPHIMEQLYGVWPGELAGVYLRSLITDNRGGERLGFGKEVVNEIIFLIELLDSHKDVPN
jgi:hypothetical protein